MYPVILVGFLMKLKPFFLTVKMVLKSLIFTGCVCACMCACVVLKEGRFREITVAIN